MRDSAGWMRWDSETQSSRSDPSTARATTSSPSTTQRSGNSAFTASTTSGKYRVSGRSLREPSTTSSPSRNAMQRNPSHLGS